MKLFLEDGSFIDTAEGIDCSIPLRGSDENPRAWYVDPPVIEPVRTAEWTGAVAEGGSVNFRNIRFNPHGHGTHTECLGHITETVHSVNGKIADALLKAYVVSVRPAERKNPDGLTDKVITAQELSLPDERFDALLIRTLPNSSDKLSMSWSDKNAPYLDLSFIALLEKCGVKHLLLDLPSVDREKDNGELAFHHAFWKVPASPDHEKTITELIFVPDEAEDGAYVLNLQTAPFENDATPSRPVLYRIHSDKIT
jgi:arylformamidase